MTCREVRKLLSSYVDGEVTPSERSLIASHIEACGVCREEVAALAALQSRVGGGLRVLAAQAEPSAQAWERLQARLAREARPRPAGPVAWIRRLAAGVGRANATSQAGSTIRRGITMKKGTVLAALGVPVLAAAIVGLVPSARAEVADTVGGWIGVRTVTVSTDGSIFEGTPTLPDGVESHHGTIMPAEPGAELPVITLPAESQGRGTLPEGGSPPGAPAEPPATATP